MVGDMGCVCPLPTARIRVCGVALTSHLLSLADANSDRWFAVPIGTAVWLATIV